MSIFFSYLTISVGSATMIIAILLGSNYLYNVWLDRKEQKDYDGRVWAILSKLSELEQWCSVEYPIIVDLNSYIKSWLLTNTSDGGNVPLKSIDVFRDELRNKYSKPQDSPSRLSAQLKKCTDEKEAKIMWIQELNGIISELKKENAQLKEEGVRLAPPPDYFKPSKCSKSNLLGLLIGFIIVAAITVPCVLLILKYSHN